MRKALRTDKGCLRCRFRRKKCDEAKPVCSACLRNQFQCIWDNTAILDRHLLPANKLISDTLSKFNLRHEQAELKFIMCNRHKLHGVITTISGGFASLRSADEQVLLIKLTGFLQGLLKPRLKANDSHVSHAITVGLDSLWVRDALLAFMSFIYSARIRAGRVDAYVHYAQALKGIRVCIDTVDSIQDKERLLVACLFLGMIEVNNPDNDVEPLLHFEAVGRLLSSIRITSVQPDSNDSLALFHRIALESYLYHVSTLSFFYARADKYPRLEYLVASSFPSDASLDMNQNVILSLHGPIYRMLFDLTKLARCPQPSSVSRADAQRLKAEITEMLNRSLVDISQVEPQSNATLHQFRIVTSLANVALLIFVSKVEDRTILASDPSIRILMKDAIDYLKHYQISRLWTGNFCWMFSILVCAAHTTKEVEALLQQLERFKAGWWGADLKRLQYVLEAVRKIRLNRVQIQGSHLDDNEQALTTTVLQEHDCLSLLLKPDGIIGY